MNSPAKKLSIIFPVYQNYENLPDLLKEIKDFSIKVDKYELEQFLLMMVQLIILLINY